MNIAVIDTGSSSMRISVMDPKGRILFSDQREYHMIAGNTGKCELPAALFSDALAALCRSSASFADNKNIRIDAVSLSSQRSSVLPLDRHLRPLGPVVMWHDKRSQDICNKINERAARQFYMLAGMKLSPVSSAPKIAYIREHQPAVYRHTCKFVSIHDYLLLLLTGQPMADSGCASRSGLFDVTGRKWADSLIGLFALDADKLCPIVPSGSIVGIVSDFFHQKTSFPKVPVISAGGDQQCSVLGQNLSDGDAGLTTGTGGYLSVPLKAPVFDPLMRTSLTASAADRWILEANTLAAGVVFRWFNENFYGSGRKKISYDAINRDIAAVPPGADGIIMLPCLSGKAAPDWNAYARGAFFNIGLGATRSAFARAVIEGICSELSDCFSTLCEVTGHAFNRLILCGGLAKASCFAQIISDMTNTPTICYNMEETTTLGAWALAAAAVSLYPSPESAVKASYASARQARYEPNASNHSLYCKIQAVRQKLYEALPHEQIYNITNGENT